MCVKTSGTYRRFLLKDDNKGSVLSKIVYAYTAYLQAPIIFLTNVGLCMIAAELLISKCELPDYLRVIGIVLGVLSGFYGMFKYLHMVLKKDSTGRSNDNNNIEKKGNDNDQFRT